LPRSGEFIANLAGGRNRAFAPCPSASGLDKGAREWENRMAAPDQAETRMGARRSDGCPFANKLPAASPVAAAPFETGI
jgi:hypothetical protein